MEIVQLTPEETRRLRSIRLRALEDAPDAFGSTLEDSLRKSENDWRTEVASLATFVARVGDADVGMIRGAPDPDDPDAAWLISMWVDPRYRRRGIGQELVAAVIDWASTRGFLRLILDVGDENEAAIALYARHGFQPDGEVGSLPPPRDHITEHRRVRTLSG